MDQSGGSALGIVIGIIICIAVLIGIGVMMYYLNPANQKPPATSVPTPTSLINCPSRNPKYTSEIITKDPSKWTSGEKDVAIWIINDQFPTFGLASLQILDNASLASILRQYCTPGATIDCVSQSADYKPKNYANWTADDRATAIKIISLRNPTLTADKLSNKSSDVIYKLLKLYCK